MSVSKEFLELVSKDDAVKEELSGAAFAALLDLLKEKGLAEEAGKAVDAAAAAVAKAHGFKAEAMEEASEDELKAVAGGKIIHVRDSNSRIIHWKGIRANNNDDNNDDDECTCDMWGIGIDGADRFFAR